MMLAKMVSKFLLPTLAISLATVNISTAKAQQAGTWELGFGGGWVRPKSDNGNVTLGRVHVGNDIKPTLTLEYFPLNNLGVQVLAAVPFTQLVYINGAPIGDLQHLPPAAFLQYHFNLGALTPTLKNASVFGGVGVEHSFIYDAKLDGALSSLNLKVSDSTGLAFHGGVDYALNPHSALRFDVYYININSTVNLQGTRIGRIGIDPFVYDVSFVWKF